MTSFDRYPPYTQRTEQPSHRGHRDTEAQRQTGLAKSPPQFMTIKSYPSLSNHGSPTLSTSSSKLSMKIFKVIFFPGSSFSGSYKTYTKYIHLLFY